MTIKLSDTQIVILSAACQRDDCSVLPLPANLKGGAASKVIDSLIAKGLIKQAIAKRGEPVWRETGDGQGITFVATDAAFEALGIAPEEAPDDADAGATGEESAPTAPVAQAARKTREGSKQAQLIAMLKRPEGASIAEIAETFGWLPHTVRGTIAGALKKKLGLEVTSEKVDDRGRVYKLG